MFYIHQSRMNIKIIIYEPKLDLLFFFKYKKQIYLIFMNIVLFNVEKHKFLKAKQT